MSVRGQALLHLCLDLSQLGVTLAILWHALKEFKPRARGFFPIRWAAGWGPRTCLGELQAAALLQQMLGPVWWC